MYDQEQLQEHEIRFVCDLVRRAGQLAQNLRSGMLPSHVIQKSEHDVLDLLTRADLVCHQMLKNELTENLPRFDSVSEEDETYSARTKLVLLIDPIDGTEGYVRGDGQFSIQIGLVDLNESELLYGWVYVPADDILYHGGPASGTWKENFSKPAVKLHCAPHRIGTVKLALGSRDTAARPELSKQEGVECVQFSGVGIKVVAMLEGKVDVICNLNGGYKSWDTAGPAAILVGAGGQVGYVGGNKLTFPKLPEVKHAPGVIMARPDLLLWCTENL